MKQQDLHKIVCSVLVLAACKVLESLKNLTMEPTPFLPKKQCLDLTMQRMRLMFVCVGLMGFLYLVF